MQEPNGNINFYLLGSAFILTHILKTSLVFRALSVP